MKLLFIVITFFSIPTWSVEYKCDAQAELPAKVTSRFKEHDSENFRKVYTGIHTDFENSIRRICEYLKQCEFASSRENDMEVRNTYAATASGKKSQSDLIRLKNQFGYTAVDAYLFDDHELNDLGNVKVTHTFKKNDRTYYLNDDRVVGFLDHVGDRGVLSRYDAKCEVAELVSFISLLPFENAVRMKVTRKYCTTAQNKGPTFKHTDQDLKSMGAFFLTSDRIEDQLEGEELCNLWSEKPEPFGLVIDTAKEPKAKPKSRVKAKTVSAGKKKKNSKSIR